MNSEQLRQFKAIAECGSLTKAADRLYISLSALSMTLTKLENETGCLLFIRKGRHLDITEDGKVLLRYAGIVVDAIDEAEAFFRTKEDIEQLEIYRIGGVGMSLLMSGNYDLQDVPPFKVHLLPNSELPAKVGTARAELIIADDRYMKSAVQHGMKRLFLYRQSLLLAVREEDPLAQRQSIGVSELENLSLIGRSGKLGFNDWLDEVKKDNRCKFSESLYSSYFFWVSEGKNIESPYLMSSFGLSVAKKMESFSNRKTITVEGKYTERDIYLWYNANIERQIQPIIDLIVSNAQEICAADEEASFND